MDEIKVLLLCSSRFAFPVMKQLVFTNQLGAVIIPAHCIEMIEETEESLAGTGIPVITVSKSELEAKAIGALEQYGLNIGLVLTFSFIIPRSVFEKPVKGFYNVHPGPLPAYRGADPIFHQLKNREKYAAVTIHRLDEGADTGDIVILEKILLDAGWTYGLLAEKLAELAGKLTATLLKIIAMGFTSPSKPQDESRAHYYEKQSPHEFAIDWNSMDADDIIALINACNPHNKGAATKINNKIIRLLRAEKKDEDAAVQQVPGTILSIAEDAMELSVVNKEVITVSLLYITEGFLPPAFLMELGLVTGMRFENIF